MTDTKYAYAVSSVRTAENNLLTKQFLDRLMTEKDELSLLCDRGIVPRDCNDLFYGISENLENAWDFLSDVAPDIKKLYFLIVKNDFHNAKAVMKGIMSNHDGREYFVSPSIVEKGVLYDAVTKKDYDSLPGFLGGCLSKAYEILTSTKDGRLFDMFMDTSSLRAMIHLSIESENDFCRKFANELVAVTDIKIALRASAVNQSGAFYDYAFCENDCIDTDGLKKACQRGTDEVLSFLSNTKYKELADGYKKSFASFEKKCDDYIMSITDRAKYVSFGIEPLVSYYYAKETECKMLRIVLSVKHAGLPLEIAEERMRELYV